MLAISAEQVAGPPHPGKPGGAIRRHGAQGGRVALGGPAGEALRAKARSLKDRGFLAVHVNMRVYIV